MGRPRGRGRSICTICDRGYDRAHAVRLLVDNSQKFTVCGQLCARIASSPVDVDHARVDRGTDRAIRRALLARELTVEQIAHELNADRPRVRALRKQMIEAGELEGDADGSNDALFGLRDLLRGKALEIQWPKRRLQGAARRSSERAHVRRGEAAHATAKAQEVAE